MKSLRDHIIMEVALGYGLTTQGEKRRYGGTAPGKGRRLDVIGSIATRLANRIDYAMISTQNGSAVTVEDIAQVISQSLASVTPEAAHATLLRGDGQPANARNELAAKIADDLLQSYEIEKKPFTGLHMIASMRNGPSTPGVNQDER